MVKFSVYFNRCVFVMPCATSLDDLDFIVCICPEDAFSKGGVVGGLGRLTCILPIHISSGRFCHNSFDRFVTRFGASG